MKSKGKYQTINEKELQSWRIFQLTVFWTSQVIWDVWTINVYWNPVRDTHKGSFFVKYIVKSEK